MENNELKKNEGENLDSVCQSENVSGETEKPASPLDLIKLDKKSLEILLGGVYSIFISF